MFSSEFSEICKNRFIERLWWLLFRGGELLDFCLLSIYRRWFSVPLFLPLRGSAVGCCRRTQHRRVFGVYALFNCGGFLLGEFCLGWLARACLLSGGGGLGGGVCGCFWLVSPGCGGPSLFGWGVLGDFPMDGAY